MEEERLLFLAVADYAYSDPEVIVLLKQALERKGLTPNIEEVSAAEILNMAKRRNPALIIVGHRPLPERSIKPLGADLVKALKSDPQTYSIPVLMLEALSDVEQIAQACGADAYLQLPVGPDKFYEAISRLIQQA
jgi:CheY-like chemotaxis protein